MLGSMPLKTFILLYKKGQGKRNFPGHTSTLACGEDSQHKEADSTSTTSGLFDCNSSTLERAFIRVYCLITLIPTDQEDP